MTNGFRLGRLDLAEASAHNPENCQRLFAEISVTVAALTYLDELKQIDAYPQWAIEILAHEYGQKLLNFEKDLELLQLSDGFCEEKQLTKVHHLVIAMEKSSYQAARQHELWEAETWRRVAAQINAELYTIQMK